MTATSQTIAGSPPRRAASQPVLLEAPEAYFVDFWARLWRGEPAERRVATGTPEVLEGWTQACQDVLRAALPRVASRLVVETASRGTLDRNGRLVTFEGGRRRVDRMPWQAWAECDAALEFSRRFFATLWRTWATGRWPDGVAPGELRYGGARPLRGTGRGRGATGGGWSAAEELLWYAALRTVYSLHIDELGLCEHPGALGLCSWLVYGGTAALLSGRMPAVPTVADDRRLPVLLVAIHGDVARQWLRDERAMREAGLCTLQQRRALSAFRRRAAETLGKLAVRWQRPDVLTALYEAWQRLFGPGGPDPRAGVACVMRAIRGLRLAQRREEVELRLMGLYGWVEVLMELEQRAQRVDSFSDDFECARTLLLLRHRASGDARAAAARVLRSLRAEV